MILGVCDMQETYHFAEAEGLCEKGLRRSVVFLVSKKVAVTSLVIGCTRPHIWFSLLLVFCYSSELRPSSPPTRSPHTLYCT